MSTLLTSGDIAELRGYWNDALSDTCILQTRVEGGGGYGYGKPTYTDGATVTCLFEPNKALSEEVGGAQALTTDGDIIFSRATALNPQMRIKLTKIYGVIVSPAPVYEIVGGPVLNHVGKRVKVKLVTDGSES